ncbi:hypothetical protein K402DRAFT_11979 [Aulographum hederae CBS 113979]|uniref:Uncharacterized protein n=1 Tax=Aulographum hederae CBS 113979 TaxID=1176131 RepID=A0A6G1H7N8_9PEZI|nr:hypothetical protein K402DRAFT_11979 [Aulographum hederae CBS 113979]
MLPCSPSHAPACAREMRPISLLSVLSWREFRIQGVDVTKVSESRASGQVQTELLINGVVAISTSTTPRIFSRCSATSPSCVYAYSHVGFIVLHAGDPLFMQIQV